MARGGGPKKNTISENTQRDTAEKRKPGMDSEVVKRGAKFWGPPKARVE